jgi:hypothetical protein
LYNPKLIRFLIMRKYTLADGNMRLSSLVPGLANAARKLVWPTYLSKINEECFDDLGKLLFSCSFSRWNKSALARIISYSFKLDFERWQLMRWIWISSVNSSKFTLVLIPRLSPHRIFCKLEREQRVSIAKIHSPLGKPHISILSMRNVILSFLWRSHPP